MATEHDVLDRLERMLAAATPGHSGQGEPGIRTRIVNRHEGDGVAWEASGEVDGAATQIADFQNPWDADAYKALRNAAPALIRLARAARAVNAVEVDSLEVIDVYDELSAATRTLAEVRL